MIDALNAALERLERELGAKPAMNGFEGHNTVRIYNLLAYGAPFTLVPVHENVLPIVEGVLDRRLPDLLALLDRHRSRRDRAADPLPTTR